MHDLWFSLHPFVLTDEVKKLREACVGAPDMSRELSRAHHYTLQLEKQIRHFLAQSECILEGERGGLNECVLWGRGVRVSVYCGEGEVRVSVYCGGGGGPSECVLWGRGRSE